MDSVPIVGQFTVICMNIFFVPHYAHIPHTIFQSRATSLVLWNSKGRFYKQVCCESHGNSFATGALNEFDRITSCCFFHIFLKWIFASIWIAERQNNKTTERHKYLIHRAQRVQWRVAFFSLSPFVIRVYLIGKLQKLIHEICLINSDG